MGRDAYAALALVTASLFLYWATLGLQQHPLLPVSPGFYPRIVLGVTAALSALLGVSEWVARRRERAPEDVSAARRSNHGQVLLAFAVFGSYVVSLRYLGFRIATCAFLVAMQAALEWPRDTRRWIAVCAVALAGTAVAYYVFEQYLRVLLPRGRLTSF
jgi:putative tricarboxylic transport membrane protein